MLYILLRSALGALRSGSNASHRESRNSDTYPKGDALPREPNLKASTSSCSIIGEAAMFRLALPQLLLAVLAFTYFHVQIINRISSGYPLWYIWVASYLVDRSPEDPEASKRIETSARNSPRSQGQVIVRGMVIYAIVQAGLFSNFLPPA